MDKIRAQTCQEMYEIDQNAGNNADAANSYWNAFK